MVSALVRFLSTTAVGVKVVEAFFFVTDSGAKSVRLVFRIKGAYSRRAPVSIINPQIFD
jgi:hypothetical protein